MGSAFALDQEVLKRAPVFRTLALLSIWSEMASNSGDLQLSSSEAHNQVASLLEHQNVNVAAVRLVRWREPNIVAFGEANFDRVVNFDVSIALEPLLQLDQEVGGLLSGYRRLVDVLLH